MKITNVFRNLALGLAITTSGLIIEVPANAGINTDSVTIWDDDTEAIVTQVKKYAYKPSEGSIFHTSDSLETAKKYAYGDIIIANGDTNSVLPKEGKYYNLDDYRYTDKEARYTFTRFHDDTIYTTNSWDKMKYRYPTEWHENKIVQQSENNVIHLNNNVPISYEEFTKIAGQEMLRLVNNHRAENGLPALEWDETLGKMATQKSQHMVEHNYMGHEYKGINTAYVQMYEWKYPTSDENCLANGEYTNLTEYNAKLMASSMFNQWKNSPGHDAAMLDKKCIPGYHQTKFGFGFAFGNSNTQYKSYATQVFAEHDKSDYKWNSDTGYELTIYPYGSSDTEFDNSDIKSKYLGGLKNLN